MINSSLDHFSPFAYPIFGNPIVDNPLKKTRFTLGEYNNWNSISPRFTLEDYILYVKKYKYYNDKGGSRLNIKSSDIFSNDWTMKIKDIEKKN